MKRKLMVISILVIALALLSTGTLAYYTNKTLAHNVITSGNVHIELEEWANKEKTEPFQNLTGIMPGASVTKIPEVVNTGSGAVWIRAKVATEIVGSDKNALSTKKGDTELVTFKLLENGWIDGKDGYFYYEKSVEPGSRTAPLFDTVTFDGAMDNPYQNCTATVTIYAQAVQSANNAIPAGGTVADVKGWPSGND